MRKPALRCLALSLAALLVVGAAVPAHAEPKAPAEFVALSDVDRTIIQEMRYTTAHNFVGEPIDGYRAPICILRVDKARLFTDGYIAEKSGHSRGSTMDLTVVRLPAAPARPYRPGEPLVPCHAPQAVRFPDDSIDMGTGFDCFDTLSHTPDPRIHGRQRANRLLLKNTLEGLGFGNLAEEWWHFTFTPEPFPNTYFDFPVARTSLAR